MSSLKEKHKVVLKAAEDYYVNNIPTGLTDEEYNNLEMLAIQDGINPRDEAFKLLRGSWVDNEDYITDIPKLQVEGSMRLGLIDFTNKNSEVKYYIPKYDGSSIVCYYNNGVPYKVVTAGGVNKTAQGVDQTWKLLKFFPTGIDTRIKALHCEALVGLHHGFGERSRQKANGLINSTKDNMIDEVNRYLNIRAFRYFTDYEGMNYLETMASLPIVRDEYGDIKFAPGYILNYYDIDTSGDLLEHDILNTDTGEFLIDGWVTYTESGQIIRALKYKSAHGEFTTVTGLKWNDKSLAGKDSWSCNAIIDPIVLKGSTFTKPSCSVNKIIKDGLGIGSLVSVELRNETIPCIGKVETRSNNVPLPVCKCGTTITLDSAYGNNLKCPNPRCDYRYRNMIRYLGSKSLDGLLTDGNNYNPSDLNGLFVIDRFDFGKKVTDPVDFGTKLFSIISEDRGYEELKGLINSLGLTGLQVRNLDLVIIPSYEAMYSRYNSLINN